MVNKPAPRCVTALYFSLTRRDSNVGITTAQQNSFGTTYISKYDIKGDMGSELC